MSTLGAQFVDHIAFVKRRAMQLLLPGIMGTLLVVIPTEYVGRKWRHCACDLGDAPLEWLHAYLLRTDGRRGMLCEGLGWMGFLVTLFVMQTILRPWALILHRRVLAPSSDAYIGEDLRCMMVWLCGGILFASFSLPGDAPLGLRGFLRPDTALAFAPAFADLLTLSIAPPRAKGHSCTVATAASLRMPALLRRIVATVALATWTTTVDYDGIHPEANSNVLWLELCMLLVFYQQGVADGIFRCVPDVNEALPGGSSVHLVVASVKTYVEKAKILWPGLANWICFLLPWFLWSLVSFIPVSGHYVATTPGFRYPAYSGSSAGNYVLRSWVVLGLAVWWWSQHVPTAVARLKTVAPFGFTLYLMHWFFIELTMAELYGAPDAQGLSGPTGLPWWLGLFFSLAITLCAAGASHIVLKAAVSRVFSGRWSQEEPGHAVKT